MTQDETWLLREKYNSEKTEGFFTDCDRLRNGEPLAYVIGSIPFLNTTIHLDAHPLIPRTETEFWVEQIIKRIKDRSSTDRAHMRILDLCAGSGCIGVALLKALPTALVDFVEIDTNLHQTIKKNIQINGIDPSRAQIFGGDLFEHCTEQYDYILSNPPYIDPMIDRTQKSVTDFEPERALYGGTHGTEIIFNIFENAPQFLTENGILVIEHEPEQVTAINTEAHEHGFLAESHPDQFSTLRYTYIYRKKDSPVTQ